eukprot:gnl/MRDRNA2_/MRDRNA2_128231_c0_seq1.p1 gnl/MRDRNA2_/MRDRNA2_128231_c0~~gnl/MRDRNA2_/MRDRNA2_128231_c0_seq1.p1  ORF type:complete len:344 (+),score=38.38 gnl/MRDRNA2_/MRDRNA2_128231_c0_seq1:112-1143(+)
MTRDNPLGTGDGAERGRSRNGNSGERDRADDDKGVEKKNGNNHPMGMAVLVFLPWLIFTMITILFALAYHHFYFGVWGMVLLLTFMSVTFFVLDRGQRMGGSWFYFLGVLCLLSILNGCLAGLYNYWTHMYPYWSYNEAETYTNVLPTEPADARQDAGKIFFSKTARVDTSRAVGYKLGTTYCVAPILDDTQAGRATVQYWAAGMDCCPSRGDFHCDDTWNPKSHSGMVLLDVGSGDQSVSTRGRQSAKGRKPSEFFGAPVADYFFKAVRLATASYDVSSAEHPIFVRWVANPDQHQHDYWRSGIGFLVAVICIYLLLAIISGAILQMWSKRSAAAQGARIGD